MSDECGVLGTRDLALKAEDRAPDDAVDRAGEVGTARTADTSSQGYTEPHHPVHPPEGVTTQHGRSLPRNVKRTATWGQVLNTCHWLLRPETEIPVPRPGRFFLPSHLGSHISFSTNSELTPRILDRDRGAPSVPPAKEESTRNQPTLIVIFYFEFLWGSLP